MGTGMRLITISLTEQQVQALAGLIDAGLRATGLRAAKDAAALMDILEAAVAAANEAKDTTNGQHYVDG
jgi:hypothetical protein